MFIQPFVALALATLSLSRSVPLTKRTGKDHWWSGLESYEVYHARYMELDCNTKHNTDFFNTCCHPRLKDTDISKIPDQCLGSADTCDEDEGDDSDNSDNNNKDDNKGDNKDDGKDDNKSDPAPSKAPVNVAPAPSVPADVPTPISTHKPKPKPKPTSEPGNGSGSSGGGSLKTGTGKGTYYLQNGNAGACGKFHPDSFKVVALDFRTYNKNLCGKTIHITNTDNGKSVDAIVGDLCPTCVSSGSVDMSVGAFTEIATKEQGEVNIKWTIDQ